MRKLEVTRDFSLTPRKENQREPKAVEPPVQFSLDEIRQHFNESMKRLLQANF